MLSHQFSQSNLVGLLGLDFGQEQSITMSVRVEVLSAGPVAAYGSVIDNLTQDPILIPALLELIGAK